MPDIGFAVTVAIPGRYFTTDLYVAVPADTADPEDAARQAASRTCERMGFFATWARGLLEVVAVRRVH